MTEPDITTDEPLDVFVYHIQRGQPKELGHDRREYGAFRMFGWTRDYERVCMLIRDTPTVAYLEFRPNKSVLWTRKGGWRDWLADMTAQLKLMRLVLLSDRFQKDIMGRHCKAEFRWKAVTLMEAVLSTPARYKESVDPEKETLLVPIPTPLLKLEFYSSFDLRAFDQHIHMDQKMQYDNTFSLYLHEADSFLDTPIRCLSKHDLSQSGWMRINSYQRWLHSSRETYERELKELSNSTNRSSRSKWTPRIDRHHWCRADQMEWDLVVGWDQLENIPDLDRAPLLPRRLMIFDIETYASRSTGGKQAYPEWKLEPDCVFQVSIVIWCGDRPQDPPTSTLLSLKAPDPKIVGHGCTTIHCKDEPELLARLIQYVDDCDVFTGWNILNYDWEYIYHRCDRHGLKEALLSTGCIEGLMGTWVEKVSDSKAHATQNFKYFDVAGKIHVDMLPIVRKNYTLRNYKLKTVLKRFKMPVNKVDLSAAEMFELYRLGDSMSMGTVGHYCRVDSEVCLDLWKRLNVWVGLLEMSKLTGVGVFNLYTKGTQIQMATRVVRVLWAAGKVLGQLRDFDPTNPSGRSGGRGDSGGISHSQRKEKKYVGATVFKAVPGLYRWVACMDFASLYPSIMRGRNLDYCTLVHDDDHPDKKDPTIPDELCNIIAWSDHVGCEHDVKRKKLKDGSFSKQKVNVVCKDNRFRWLKEEVVGEGLLPNLLTGYLNARKTTRKRMGAIRKNELTPLIASVLVRLVITTEAVPTADNLDAVQRHYIFDEITNTGEKEVTLEVVQSEWSLVLNEAEKHVNISLEAIVESIRTVLIQLVVLDKRQLAYKVCANCFPDDHEILTSRGFMNLEAVRDHFKTHEYLDVACIVNGELEYRSIKSDKLVVAEGEHDMVAFDNNNLVSLQATANHRMLASYEGEDGSYRSYSTFTAGELADRAESVWIPQWWTADSPFTTPCEFKPQHMSRFRWTGTVWCLSVPVQPPLIIVRRPESNRPLCTLNSAYGATGAEDGIIPLMQIAACTTAQGREWVKLVADWTTKEYGAECVYGDSVTGDTPIWIRDPASNDTYLVPIGELARSMNPRPLATSTKTYYEPQSVSVEVWSDRGWTRLLRVIEHRANKPVVRITTNTGSVDVTLDHSLLREDSSMVQPSVLKLGDTLMHHTPPNHPVPTQQSAALVIDHPRATVMGLILRCGTFVGSSTLTLAAIPSLYLASKVYAHLVDVSSHGLQRISHLNEGVVAMRTKRGVTTIVLDKCKDLITYYRHCTREGMGVPDYLYSADIETLKAFWVGWSMSETPLQTSQPGLHTRFNVRTKLLAAGLYWVATALGMDVSITDTTTDLQRPTFELSIGNRDAVNARPIREIKTMVNLGRTSETIYDLETENHHFAAGVGQLIVHNTDSVFLYFPKLVTEDRKETITALSAVIEPLLSRINTLFPKQVRLEFEKVFEDLILLSKKRYMGVIVSPEGVYLDRLVRGCALVRRDFGPLVTDLYKSISDRMLVESRLNPRDKWHSWRQSLYQEVSEYILKLFHGTRSIQDFILSCGIARPRLGYKPTAGHREPKHILLWDRIEGRQDQMVNGQRLPSGSNVFTPGMRIEFVAIDTPVLPEDQQFVINPTLVSGFIGSKKKLQYHFLEEVDYYLKWKHVLRLNVLWYVQSQLYNPMDELMNAVFNQPDGVSSPSTPIHSIMHEQLSLHVQRRNTNRLILERSRPWIRDDAGKLIGRIEPPTAAYTMLHQHHSTEWWGRKLKRLTQLPTIKYKHRVQFFDARRQWLDQFHKLVGSHPDEGEEGEGWWRRVLPTTRFCESKHFE